MIRGVMRVSFYVEREKQKKIVDHQVWSTIQLFEALATIQTALGLMAEMARKQVPITYLPAAVIH